VGIDWLAVPMRIRLGIAEAPMIGV